MEPVVLGLLLFSTPAGWLIGAAALSVFLAREPLRVAGQDLVIRRHAYPRTMPALGIAGFWLIVGAGTVTWAAVGRPFLVFFPLLLAAPLALLQLVADLRGKRSLSSEVAGALAISTSIIVIALLGGSDIEIAATLWLLVTGRSVGAILLVRAMLARFRGDQAPQNAPTIIHLIVVGIAGVLLVLDLAPVLALFATTLLLGRAIFGLRSAGIARPQRIGMQEVFWGIVFVGLTFLGFTTGI